MTPKYGFLNVCSAGGTRTVAIMILLLFFLNGSAAFGQCSFQGLGQLPGGFVSAARAVSSDGQVVVGHAVYNPPPPFQLSIHPFRWTLATGMVDLFPLSQSGFGVGVSGDGAVVVGSLYLDGFSGGFRWTTMGDAIPLTMMEIFGVSGDGRVLVGVSQGASRLLPPYVIPEVLDPEWLSGEALAASWDGSVVVGSRYVGPDRREPFRWTAPEGMVSLGGLGGSPSSDAAATAVSSDGAVVVGYVPSAAAANSYTSEAFMWTEGTGIVGLGFLPDAFFRYSRALGISGDGAIVVGEANGRFDEGKTAFVWTKGQGMRRLSDILTMDCNIDLTGWYLRAGQDLPGGSDIRFGISTDGTAIVGAALGPDRTNQAFIARISRGFADCNHNGIDDAAELAIGTATDCDANGRLDVCDIDQCADDADCADCNGNSLPDGCDIASGTLTDADLDGVPDECDDCCNGCDDGNACTLDVCVRGVCLHSPTFNGDLHPCGGDGVIDVDDLLAALSIFAGTDPCACTP